MLVLSMLSHGTKRTPDSPFRQSVHIYIVEVPDAIGETDDGTAGEVQPAVPGVRPLYHTLCLKHGIGQARIRYRLVVLAQKASA